MPLGTTAGLTRINRILLMCDLDPSDIDLTHDRENHSLKPKSCRAMAVGLAAGVPLPFVKPAENQADAIENTIVERQPVEFVPKGEITH